MLSIVVLWAGRTGDPHGDQPDRGLLELTVGPVVAARRVLGAQNAGPRA